MLPKALRRMFPDSIRHSPRLRAWALRSGVIPPRVMHSEEEAELFAELARSASKIVEIGVYEGASAIQLGRSMGSGGELHLIDPFGRQPDALPQGWGASEKATRRVVERALRDADARVVWHPCRSDEAAAGWIEPVDLVFVDGDHSESGAMTDWRCWNEHVRPGGLVAFHDARLDKPHGRGLPGPTAVVDRLFRGDAGVEGWAIVREVDRTVVVERAG